VKSRVAGGFILPATGKISDRIKSYGRGRVCEAWGCATILSTYNPAHLCSAHQRVARQPEGGRQRAS
jgi:hypothetical protein